MNKLKEIKEYIENNYDIVCEETLNCRKIPQLLMKDKKYDVTIKVEKPDSNHYLYGKCDYVIDCNYDANKKHGTELCWHGGGYSCEYTHENIDKFLNNWFDKKKEKQLSIFDVIGC